MGAEMAIKAIIFDFDGTLVNARLKVREAKDEFIKKLRELGFTLENLDPKTPSELIMQLLIEKYGISRESLMKVLDECFQPYELEVFEKAELRQGAREIIVKLKEKGYRLGIASNNGRMIVRRTLEKLGILDYFDVIVARGDVDRIKPDGSSISECIKRLGVKPCEAVYVGDMAMDVVAARNAGVHVIGVLGGLDSKSSLERINPDYLIEDLSQVIQAIEAIEKREMTY